MARPGDLVASRFELEAVAGTGGMGEVWRACDRFSKTFVALKLMDGREDRVRARFEREAEALGRIVHEGVVRYVAHGCDAGGVLWLAMEWLEGEDLRRRLDRGFPSPAETLVLAQRIAHALREVHAGGMVHRDIKPSNVLLVGGSVERAKLVDFGIVYSKRASAMTDRRLAVGTPGYMAPEQARGELDVDARADVFSLGCLLYECLTGRPAFAGDHVLAILAKVLFEEPPRLRQLRLPLPSGLDALLFRMLSKNPAARPADGGEVLSALEALDAAPVREIEVGLTAPPPSLGPEEQRMVSMVVAAPRRATMDEAATITPDQQREADSALQSSLVALGAHLERLADGSLAALLEPAGVPGDQAALAARCALAMANTLPDHQVVLATGRAVHAGSIPRGEVIDRAARMLRSRSGSGVLIDELSAALLAGRFELETSGQGVELRAERVAPEPAGALLGRSTPCVGRELEIAALSDTLERCIAERRAQVTLVTGAPGMGKSRLRRELLDRLHGRGVEIMTGYAEPMSEGSAYSILGQALRRAAGIRSGEPLGAGRAKLRARVRRYLARGVDRVTEFLGELAGVPFPDGGSAQLRAARADPMLMGDQMRRAFEEVVVAACAARPLLIVLEDLHWGDVPSVRLVGAALRRAQSLPMMVLAFARPDVHTRFPGLWRECALHEIRLAALPRAASEELVRGALPDGDDASLARVLDRGAGNPLMLEELVRAVVEGRGESTPETVLAMVDSRLQALPPEARRVLRAGSVFGRSFWRGGVAALLGSEVGLDPLLAQLADKEVVSPRSASRFVGECEWRFRHELVREAAYGTLTAEDRTLGHKLAGTWLESVGERDAMTLAEHFRGGDNTAKAAHWYRRAAEEALAGNDLDAAAERAARGLAADAEGADVGALNLVECDARAWKGEHDGAEASALRAADVLTRGSETWFAAVGRVVLECRRLGHVDLATSTGEAIASAWPGQGAVPNTAVVAACEAAGTLLYGGKYDLAKTLLRLVEDELGSAWTFEPVVAARVHIARSLRGQIIEGDPSAIAEHLEEAAACFERVGDARNACVQHANRGYGLLLVGQHRASEEELRAAMASAAQLGLATLVAVCQHNLGPVVARLGRMQEARELERASIDHFAERGDVRLESIARCYLAEILLTEGDAEAAAREIAIALERVTAAVQGRAVAFAVLSRTLLARGRTREALEAARKAQSILEGLGSLTEGEERIRLSLVEALHATDGLWAARDAIADARTRVLARAERIRRPDWRASFLSEVPQNARTLRLAAEWLEGGKSSRA